jgi:hypothetical protein
VKSGNLRPVGLGHVDGDAARRQAVLVQVADGTEIGGPEESHPVILAPVLGLLVGQAAFLKRKPAKPLPAGSWWAGLSAGMSK